MPTRDLNAVANLNAISTFRFWNNGRTAQYTHTRRGDVLTGDRCAEFCDGV